MASRNRHYNTCEILVCYCNVRFARGLFGTWRKIGITWFLRTRLRQNSQWSSAKKAANFRRSSCDPLEMPASSAQIRDGHGMICTFEQVNKEVIHGAAVRPACPGAVSFLLNLYSNQLKVVKKRLWHHPRHFTSSHLRLSTKTYQAWKNEAHLNICQEFGPFYQQLGGICMFHWWRFGGSNNNIIALKLTRMLKVKCFLTVWPVQINYGKVGPVLALQSHHGLSIKLDTFWLWTNPGIKVKDKEALYVWQKLCSSNDWIVSRGWAQDTLWVSESNY